MIVEFSVKNFRSIKDLQTISFVSTGLKSSKKNEYVDINNTALIDGMSIFKTIGIYGANASGKSNIIKALDYFIKAIAREPSSESKLNSLSDPFFYQDDNENSESFFQIVLFVNDIKYRYGITVKKNIVKKRDNDTDYSKEIITKEWLFGKKDKNMSALFTRTNEEIDNKLQNKDLIPNNLPYKHTLFLTHASAFDSNGECTEIRNYLRGMTTSNFNISHNKFRWMSLQYIDGEVSRKNQFLELLSAFNLKYDDVHLLKDDESNQNDIFPQEKIIFTKSFKDSSNKDSNITLNLKYNESAGSQKLFDLAGLLLRAFNLPKPAFIILDEIDSNFHPSLLIKLVELFNNPKINLGNSQLLFTSHDTNLMSPSIMRRDQFYFTEKNEDLSTRLYSLADLKGVRNNANFAKEYLAGYYGALPILENYKAKSND